MRSVSLLLLALFATTTLAGQGRTDDRIQLLHFVDRDLPVRQLQLAESMLRWGQSENALLAYDAILTQRPGWIPALVARARVYQIMGRSTAADRELRAARQLSPLATDFYSAGISHSLLPFIALYPRVWLDDRFGTTAGTAIRSQTEERELLASLGEVEDSDLALIRNKLELTPNQLQSTLSAALYRRSDVWAEFMWGNLALLGQDLLTARRHYNNALSAGAEWPELYYNRGITHLLQYDYSQGCADLAQSYETGYVPALALHTGLCTY